MVTATDVEQRASRVKISDGSFYLLSLFTVGSGVQNLIYIIEPSSESGSLDIYTCLSAFPRPGTLLAKQNFAII